MSITFIGLLGLVGISFLLLSYFLLIVGQLKVIDVHYITLNMVGAFLIVFSLLGGGTIPLLHVLMIWLFISVYGFYKHQISTTT